MDEAGLAEQLEQRRRLRDHVAALLDDAVGRRIGGLGLRPEQVEEEPAAGLVPVRLEGGFERVHGAVEPLARDEAVEPADPVGLEPAPPPIAPEPAQELPLGHLARQSPGSRRRPCGRHSTGIRL